MAEPSLVPIIIDMKEQLGRIKDKLQQHNKFDDRLKETSKRTEEAFDTATAAKAIAQSTQRKVNGTLGLVGAGAFGPFVDWIRKHAIG